MALPKINIGKQTSGFNKFDLSHDVNTTADFGSIQPLTCIELIPKQKVSLSTKSQVTLMPLVVPTGGRISYKIFHQFVPMHDLLESFDSLYANLNYNSNNGSYIPQSVPTVTPSFLVALLLSNSYFDVYDYTTQQVGEQAQVTFTQHTKSDGSIHSWTSLETTYVNAINNYFGFNFGAQFGLPYGIEKDYFKEVVDGAQHYHISLDEADFIINCGNNIQFRFKLSNAGKRLRKVFVGLGYALNAGDKVTNLTALPLFAYYKAYFDLFEIQRNVTYLDTPAYSALQMISSRGTTNLVSLFNGTITQNDLKENLSRFFYALKNCFYTENNNFVSAHIPTPAIVNQTQIKNSTAHTMSVDNFTLQQNTQADLYNAENSSQINQILMGLRLQKLSNISTALGKRLKEYWLAMTGTADLHLPESNFIGKSSQFVEIDPLFASTEAENQSLGEMAGKSITRGGSERFHYTASTFGYLISFGVVVPHGGMYQGNAPHLYHRTRWEFFNGIMDSMGFELTPKSQVVGDYPVADTLVGGQSFGFIPRYSGYKVHNSVVNGDMSIRGLRTSLLPYTLDKFITTPDYEGQTEFNEGGKLKQVATFYGSDIPIASESWRYVNRYKWLSNYNRIFAENGDNDYKLSIAPPAMDWAIDDDPIIINNVFEVDSYAPMLSIADSFDTDAFGEHIEVDKA